ncbi:MAG TPA: CheR family methyltransferase [Caulobacteraceae bacterium]|nr:CheR family methyltransferase [Caulobacteraceae bacterium]
MAVSRNRFPIVGIGASAGGVEALEAFFRGLPDDSGCAFVIVTHLNPDRRSLLPEIVARYTHMPVNEAVDGVEVDPNEVHILPAHAVLGIADGRLSVRRVGSTRRDRKPIDVFFAALAKDQGEYAAGIVLSGGDTDGTLGVKAIKEHGGLTLAQIADGTRPQHPEMPDAAIASGLIDIASPAQEMGSRLVDFARSFEMFDSLIAPEGSTGQDKTVQAARREICAIIRNQLGHDFSGYKEKTFLRRVQRRMQVNHVDTLEGYVERLRQEPKEVGALFRDLLINVTNFFRDADAFQILEEKVIPKLFEGRSADETIRVWVPGCATGEEVFSLGILLLEQMHRLEAPSRVQIFATDIDEPALSVARAARYPAALLETVSEERRRRFFTHDEESYVVTKEVRDLCVFSPHSVIRDPPFSRLDLISCRNLLIYFGIDAQNQAIPTFGYALKPGGYLFLGTSENVSQFNELFTAVDKKHRIFRRREDAVGTPRLPLTLPGLRLSAAGQARPGPLRGLHAGGALRQIVESQVLDRYSPAHVVVNREGDVVYYSPKTGKYLEASPGVPTRQLTNMARRGLRLDLRTALREAVETDRGVERAGLAVEGEDGRIQRVDLAIEPLAESAPDERLFLVIFSDVGPTLTREEAAHVPAQAEDSVVQLERELRETRERLQSLIEEYETALEELKSSNEELVSVNEELQSTNEELEASKEELQSLNEELHTVNAELNGKVDQLDRANADLTNLFESTKVATIFLDRDLVIRSFTPAASHIFRILPGDRGRPLTDLTSRVPLPTVAEDVRSVFATGQSLERTVEHETEGAEYLLRLVPYRDVDRTIAGVVLTFIDVTTVRKIGAHQKVLIAELNHRVKNMLMIVISVAELTYKDSPDAAAFKDRLVERVKGMSRSYELIARENWTEAVIHDLVNLQLAPFGADRATLVGPAARLRPKAALSLGMILHELATNAAKYGALSNHEGRIELSWNVDDDLDDPGIRLVWREHGGPPVTEPPRRGFGLRLIESETAHTLGGRSEVQFQPDGVSAVIEFRATGR